MGLRLKIENMTSLPDGGPLGIEVRGRSGMDIGRDQHLDWTLPDPTRFISGKHCEIRFKDGAYWLHDVSTNGTFLNDAEERMRSPHRLRTGDRLEIGDYIVAVTVELEAVAATTSNKPAANAPYEDLWSLNESAAPPLRIEPVRMARRDAPAAMDFLDRLVDSSGPARDAMWNDGAQPARPAPRPATSEIDWSTEGALPRVNFGPTFGKQEDVAWSAAASQSASVPPLPVPPLPVPPLPVPPLLVPALPVAPLSAPPPMPQAAEAPEPVIAAAPLRATPPTFARPEASDGQGGDFLRMVAQGAGVPETVFASHTPDQLAEELGLLLRLTALNLQQLLSSRSELKDVVRSSSHTTIVKDNNNPLKFSPNVEEAIRLMFAPASSSYLDAAGTIEQTFTDLKQHQAQTFAAMQGAIALIERDLDPKTIEAEAEVERGLASLGASRKSKLWDAYVSRWRIGVARHENGLLGVFLNYFASHYDQTRINR